MNSRYMQYVAAITSAWLAACSHMITGWNSPAIAKLTSNDSPIGVTLTDEEASWVASIPMLGFIAGSVVSSYFTHKFGTKHTLVLSTLPIIFSWIVIAITNSIATLIAMRCLAGFGDGFIITALPLYVGEVTDKDIRGGLTTTISVLNAFGNVLLYSVGPFISYTALALLCAAITVIVMIALVLMPDSPYFLCKKRKQHLTKKNLKRLLGNNVDEEEFEKRLLEIQLTVSTNKNRRLYFKDFYEKRNYRRAIILITALKLFQHLSGMSALKSYLQTIIQFTESSISPEISSIIFGFVQIPSVLLAAFLMDRVGRRWLYISSALSCATCLMFEALYFFLQQSSSKIVANFLWLPTLSLTMYLISAPLGLSSVPFVVIGEVIGSDIKDFASPFSTTMGAITSFLSTKYFLPLSIIYGMHTMFAVYGCTCVIASIFVFFMLPETKGKSFLEIQELLKTKSCC
ncbi:hypothetical protein FQR65_LT13192 [Abscondita terminalis]|nr:hypothetical protein FQR65_LT13192 [Abscondita terminalis]